MEVQERAVSPVIGTVLMVAIVVALAAIAGVAVFGFSEETEDPRPAMVLDTEFTATSEFDPHWTINVTHESGDTIEPDELRVQVTDDDGSVAEVFYPEYLRAGESFSAGLWGDAARADTDSCLVDPTPQTDQLDGWESSAHAETVDVLVIHDPSNHVLVDKQVDLSAEPNRFSGDLRHYLVDGVTPSIDCETSDF